MSTDSISTWECHWSKGDIPWQLPDVNQLLLANMEELVGGGGVRNGEVVNHKTILVPLCGKSQDLYYLYQQGHTVVGCEWVEAGCVQFFAEHNISYSRAPLEHAEGSLFQVKGGGVLLRCSSMPIPAYFWVNVSKGFTVLGM